MISKRSSYSASLRCCEVGYFANSAGVMTKAHQPGTIHGSKAVGEPPLMLAISVREAIRDALHAFDIPVDFILPSPCTGEAVKSLIGN